MSRLWREHPTAWRVCQSQPQRRTLLRNEDPVPYAAAYGAGERAEIPAPVTAELLGDRKVEMRLWTRVSVGG